MTMSDPYGGGPGGPGMWDPMPLTPPAQPSSEPKPGELIWSRPEPVAPTAEPAKPAAEKPAVKRAAPKKPAKKKPAKKKTKAKKKAKKKAAKKRPKKKAAGRKKKR